MTNVILLKTRRTNLGVVVQEQKHALTGRLTRAQQGDLLLLAEILPRGPARATHAMWFKDQRPAAPGEAEKLWNDGHWPFIVEGEGCRPLEHPFSPEEAKVSAANYRHGGTVFYITAEDVSAFQRGGRLRPFL